MAKSYFYQAATGTLLNPKSFKFNKINGKPVVYLFSLDGTPMSLATVKSRMITADVEPVSAEERTDLLASLTGGEVAE